MEWNYKSEIQKSNGYEDVLDDLKKWNKEKFLKQTEDKQKEIIEDIFNIYRKKNIFPIQYYNEEGIKREIQGCIDKKVSFDGDVLDLKFNQGSSLCRFLFPNLSQVNCKNSVNNSPYDKFYDDYKLKKAIEFCLKHKNSPNPVTPSGIKDGLEMLGGNVATNFKPMNAKALYEKYVPKNGVIYDFACGFGGRMIGALSSKNNYKYYGVEPNTETFDNLNKLGRYIENVTKRENSFKIKCIGSENINIKKENVIDFAFSSPPYFTLEKYCEEETQCYIKYPTIEEWFEKYVKPTIENIYKLLKNDRYYAVNIADFKLGNNIIWLVDEWIKISKEVGFVFNKNINMKLQARRGTGHDVLNKRTKQEGIFVFYKGDGK